MTKATIVMMGGRQQREESHGGTRTELTPSWLYQLLFDDFLHELDLDPVLLLDNRRQLLPSVCTPYFDRPVQAACY